MELVMLILSALMLVINIVSVVIAGRTLHYTKKAATTTNSDGSVATEK